jgi:hypothetical protein
VFLPRNRSVPPKEHLIKRLSNYNRMPGKGHHERPLPFFLKGDEPYVM